MIRVYLFAGLLALGGAQNLSFCQTHLVTVKQAVSTRRLATDGVHGEVAISPDGTQVAYILKAPDVRNNSNNYELYVRRLEHGVEVENGELLLHAERLSGIQWFDNRTLGVVRSEGKDQAEVDRLSIVDTRSGDVRVVLGPTGRIRSFSADGGGREIVLCAAARKETHVVQQQVQDRYGFRVAPGEPITDASLIKNWFPDSYLYLIESRTNERSKLRILRPVGPSNFPVVRFHGEVDDLALSPDGRFLLFRYETTRLPAEWHGTFYANQIRSIPFPVPVWAILDLKANRFKIAFDAPAYGYGPAVWSADSRSFAVSALAPEGSSWERQDFESGFTDLKWQWDSFLHLFSVDVQTGLVSEVLHRYRGLLGAKLRWHQGSSSLLVPLDAGILVRIDRISGAWKEKGRSLLFAQPMTLQGISRDGNLAIGLLEEISTPPNLVLRDVRRAETHVLTDWNPEYRDLALGVVQEMDWVNKYGVRCSGDLIMPVGYSPGSKYPLVIMNRSGESFFVSDESYTTAFPPQPLASLGFVVLMAEYSFDVGQLPTGFPGRLAEAYNWMAMVESGVDSLVSRGIVDGSKVGIIGFSRTSWKTDFMLTHSKLEFAAASSADSGLYNYGVYSLLNDSGTMADADEMLGGPPYGKTLDNWLQYAPAFNAQHVSCPLLMEYVGFGHMPFGPTNAYEFFTALYRQHKPVELFFYPLGDHPLDTPSERVASLQRNVDWFRFWLQGYQGVAPVYDPHQYDRWRELRKEQQRNTKKMNQLPTSSE